MRRALLEPVVGLLDALLWTPLHSLHERQWPAMGTVLTAAAIREQRWLCPADLSPPDPVPVETLAQVLYALVRRRAITEELLMERSDADLCAPACDSGTHGRSLGDVMRLLAARELRAAALLRALRSYLQPGWNGANMAWVDGMAPLAKGW